MKGLAHLTLQYTEQSIMKMFVMHQKVISADDTAAVLSVQFMRASVRFVASMVALIGVSLLLASL